MIPALLFSLALSASATTPDVDMSSEMSMLPDETAATVVVPAATDVLLSDSSDTEAPSTALLWVPVFLLGAAAIVLQRKKQARGPSGRLRIVDALQLGKGRAILVVDIRGKEVLVAATDAGITLLDTPLPEAPPLQETEPAAVEKVTIAEKLTTMAKRALAERLSLTEREAPERDFLEELERADRVSVGGKLRPTERYRLTETLRDDEEEQDLGPAERKLSAAKLTLASKLTSPERPARRGRRAKSQEAAFESDLANSARCVEDDELSKKIARLQDALAQVDGKVVRRRAGRR